MNCSIVKCAIHDPVSRTSGVPTDITAGPGHMRHGTWGDLSMVSPLAQHTVLLGICGRVSTRESQGFFETVPEGSSLSPQASPRIHPAMPTKSCFASLLFQTTPHKDGKVCFWTGKMRNSRVRSEICTFLSIPKQEQKLQHPVFPCGPPPQY